MESIHYVDTMNFGQVINEQQLKEKLWGRSGLSPLCACWLNVRLYIHLQYSLLFCGCAVYVNSLRLALYLNQSLEDEPSMVTHVQNYLNMIVVEYIMTVMRDAVCQVNELNEVDVFCKANRVFLENK